MNILFPVAGVNLNIMLVFGLGGIVGLLSGLFGVGGGFLLTPLLMMAGVPPAVAAASDSNQIVAASISGTMAHGRVGNVDWKLGLIMVAGGLAGGTAGTQLVHFLRAQGNFEFVLKVTYVIMLLVIGSSMFLESIRTIFKKQAAGRKQRVKLFALLPGKKYFPVSGVECPVYALFGLGLLVGILSALMGVGGGFIMLPVLIYMVGMPTAVAVGTSLITVLFTAVSVTFSQSLVNHTVDIMLAMILLLGSSMGAQIGVRVGRLLKGEQLRVIFSLIVLAVMIKLMHDLVVPGGSMITLAGGGN